MRMLHRYSLARKSSRDQPFRLANILLSAGIVLIMLDVLVILLTGGRGYDLRSLRIATAKIEPPVIALLLLIVLRFSLPLRTWSRDTFLAHAPVVLFCVVLAVYIANGKTIQTGDATPARYLPFSILREGNFDFDEFRFLYAQGTPYYLEFVNGHYVSWYPIGAGLLAIPVYLPSAMGHTAADSPFVIRLEKLAAASIVAVSVVLLYLTLRRLTGLTMSLLATASYAFGSSSLSVSSQALWQHGASQLALATTLYYLVRGRAQARWIAPAGLALSFAVISRPTDLLIAVPLVAYALFYHVRQVPWFLLAGIVPAMFQLVYNATYFADPLRTQPLLGSEFWNTPLWDGLTGILLSPGRGLFVYSPIFLISLAGIALAWLKEGDPLVRFLSVGMLFNILLYSKFTNWWGGFSYGPRLLADLTPVLALSLYPLDRRFSMSGAWKALIICLLAWSVAAHSIGAFMDDGLWNPHPDVNRFPKRLWSWTDNQLVNPPARGLRHFLLVIKNLPTSQTDPQHLSAKYRVTLEEPTTVLPRAPLQLEVHATNDGQAVWLAKAKKKKGVVRLRWCWVAEHAARLQCGREGLRYDVFPASSHIFALSLDAPHDAGRYLLEIGLVSENVASFSDLGTPPFCVPINVKAHP